MTEGDVQWLHYENVPEGEALKDRFRHFWKPTHAFGSDQLDISVIEMEPGQKGPKHSHDEPMEEYYMVLEGEIEVRFPDDSVTGSAGTFFFFKPGAVHRPLNTSDQPARLLSLRVRSGDEDNITLE